MIRLTEILMHYFYHATTADALPLIVKAGLIPSKKANWSGEIRKHSLGKVFVTNNFDDAMMYGNYGIWDHQHTNRFRPILRFKYDENQLVKDIENDWYSKTLIKSKFEIFVPNINTLVPDSAGDTEYDENKGQWKLLTIKLASEIYLGKWDGEIIDDKV